MPDEKQILKFRDRMPVPLRAILAGIGVFVVLMPFWELRRLFWPVTPFTAIAAVFALGAASVGGAFILGGLYGRNVFWTIRPGRIRIIARSFIGRPRILTFQPKDGTRLEVEEDTSSDGPDYWRVTLIDTDGRRFRMGKHASPAGAEAEYRQVTRLFNSRAAA
ncbi:MAG: hypothetical protein R3C13_14365 [Hyphomonas sp.]|uniref:hypothetical protein n=1 Tax=Hyphomonas sp. TaxID=87 RepID=UPI0035294849